MTKVLFICRFRQGYSNNEGGYSYSETLSSGLFNSARLVKDMLNENHISAELEHAIDGNCIDRLIIKHERPEWVILEALWVTPAKLVELNRLHPKVKFIVRNHSNLPFLATEGIAINWLTKYVLIPNVFIASNTENSVEELKNIVQGMNGKEFAKKVLYFPNYYKEPEKAQKMDLPVGFHIGCFGAIRVLKNQLLQGVAAIEYSLTSKEHVYFHVNSGRVEGGWAGDNVLKNLRSMFAEQKNATLVEHTWLTHNQFLQLTAAMDVLLQVSYSETFNIVAADAVVQDVPVVVSEEIFWASDLAKCDFNSSKEMVKKMKQVVKCKMLISYLNLRGLRKYNENSRHKIIMLLE